MGQGTTLEDGLRRCMGFGPGVSRYVRGRLFTPTLAGLRLRSTVPCHAFVGVAGTSVVCPGYFLLIHFIFFLGLAVAEDVHSPMGGE